MVTASKLAWLLSRTLQNIALSPEYIHALNCFHVVSLSLSPHIQIIHALIIRCSHFVWLKYYCEYKIDVVKRHKAANAVDFSESASGYYLPTLFNGILVPWENVAASLLQGTEHNAETCRDLLMHSVAYLWYSNKEQMIIVLSSELRKCIWCSLIGHLICVIFNSIAYLAFFPPIHPTPTLNLTLHCS